jgi:hypothetical protein
MILINMVFRGSFGRRGFWLVASLGFNLSGEITIPKTTCMGFWIPNHINNRGVIDARKLTMFHGFLLFTKEEEYEY